MKAADVTHPSSAELLAMAVGASEQSPHLAMCDCCRRKLQRVTTLLHADRAAACLEAEGMFPPDRLQHQREQIAKRLELLGRPARILPFPRVASSGRPLRPLTSRWIAVAAAAGLIAGIITGRAFRFEESPAGPKTVLVQKPLDRHGAGHHADEEFLSSIDAVLASTRAAELRELEEITPRVREVAVNLR